MPTEHTVLQGEHITRIARKFGFFDFRTIFDDPANAELKEKRPNPDVLFPGDVVIIPDKQKRVENRPTDQLHRFELLAPLLLLRIKLTHIDHEPLPDTDCDLLVEGQVHNLRTAPDGLVELEIAETAERGNLSFKDQDVPFDIKEVLIGHLDPVEERSGQLARLANLGYYLGPLDVPNEEELSREVELEFKSAVEEFQIDFMGKQEVDGKCGKKTQAKLLAEHGC